MDKTPKYFSIFFSLSSMIIAVFVLLLLHNYYILIIVGLFYGLGHAIMFPVLGSLYVDLGNEEDKTIMYNTYVTFYTFGSVIIGTLLGFVGDIFGTFSIFLIMFLIFLICLLSGLFLKKKVIKNYLKKIRFLKHSI